MKAVFERLVDIICEKMSESLDSDPTLMSNSAKGEGGLNCTRPIKHFLFVSMLLPVSCVEFRITSPSPFYLKVDRFYLTLFFAIFAVPIIITQRANTLLRVRK